MNPVDTRSTMDMVNNKVDALNALNTTEDYGEPVYVEAHGGKNHVIMYRSRTNPELAIEFFFRFVSSMCCYSYISMKVWVSGWKSICHNFCIFFFFFVFKFALGIELVICIYMLSLP